MTMRTNSGLWITGALALLLCTAQPAFCTTTIDIMLVYDTTAKTWVDSNGGGMAAFSADVVNRMNQATANSGLDLTFRLVHSEAVSYTHSGSLNTDLLQMQAGTGGLAGVHTLRDTHAADLVAMLVDTGSAYGFTGLGYVLTTYAGLPDYAFTVDSIRSVEISHTATHEVGHNLGADHSKYQAQSPGPNSALNTYAAGWYFWTGVITKYHTIMAYGNDGYGYNYDPAPMFSTPLKTYQGTVAGDAADGDNTRTIGDTMTVVSAYRTSTPPTPTPNPNAYQAYINAYFAYYYAKYLYENYHDVGNLLWDEYAYSYYGYYYASYSYLYDAQDGNNRGFAYLAYVYSYYGYLCGYNAYSRGYGYSYYVMSYNYDACVYSYLVHIGQRSNQEPLNLE